MSEGEPDFSFEPFGPSDHLKTIIWKHLMRMVMSQCEYKLHQEIFFRDYFVMGCGVFETYIDYPERTIRIPNPAWPGGFEPVVTQDLRRPKVGVRAVNPLNCWRNPNIDSPSQVSSCLRRRIVTWNQFTQEFGRCFMPDGSTKYENLDKIAKGTHICLYYYQDEIRDIYRIYAKSFGNQTDGNAMLNATVYPMMQSLGIRIFNKPLKIHEEKVAGVITRSTGLNIPGMCSLRWGTLFDKYDKNFEGNHSVYGMGLPERIEGEDVAIQTMFNMYLDQERWAGTTVLNYKGNNADSYMDVDANRFYGAELVDGEITPMNLGISRPNSYESFQDIMDKNTIPSTGINHQQMTGDTSKTAFEFAQRIKAANRGAEQRLARLEAEVFKPMGSLLLANSLTVLTVEEYEAMTEEQVSSARDLIKQGKRPVSDYKDLNTDAPQKRQMTYIPMKGEKIREDFSITKKRKLDYNADYTAEGKSTNTLITDPSMNVETSYVPMISDYVYPTEYVDSGLLPDCIVDSSRMLTDMKAQDVANFQAATNFLLQLMLSGYKGLDLDKVASMTLEFANIDPKNILTNESGGSDVLNTVKNMLGQMQTAQVPPPQNAQVPAQAPTVPNFGTAPAQSGGQQPTQGPLAALTTGGL